MSSPSAWRTSWRATTRTWPPWRQRFAGRRSRFHASTWIAVTGADISPRRVDGRPIPAWESVEIEAGSVLAFGDLRDGMRAYVAVKRRHRRAPRHGQPLDLSEGGVSAAWRAERFRRATGYRPCPADADAVLPKRLPKDYTAPVYGGIHRLRVVPGPQDHAFDADALSKFLTSRYRIHSDSDRMGYMLDGPKIEHREGADIVSDGNPPGAIQIHGERHPAHPSWPTGARRAATPRSPRWRPSTFPALPKPFPARASASGR